MSEKRPSRASKGAQSRWQVGPQLPSKSSDRTIRSAISCPRRGALRKSLSMEKTSACRRYPRNRERSPLGYSEVSEREEQLPKAGDGDTSRRVVNGPKRLITGPDTAGDHEMEDREYLEVGSAPRGRGRLVRRDKSSTKENTPREPKSGARIPPR